MAGASIKYPAKKSLTAIILAGGQNRRIGIEKAFLAVGNKPIILRQIENLRKIFSEIIIVTNKPRLYKNLNAKIVSDIIPAKGPLGGLYTGLLFSNNIYNFVIACDMPFVDRTTILNFFKFLTKQDIVVPEHNGRIEPLFAFYSKNCLGYIEKNLRTNHLGLRDLIYSVKNKAIVQTEKFYLPKNRGSLFFLPSLNINTLDNYITLTNY